MIHYQLDVDFVSQLGTSLENAGNPHQEIWIAHTGQIVIGL